MQMAAAIESFYVPLILDLTHYDLLTLHYEIMYVGCYVCMYET